MIKSTLKTLALMAGIAFASAASLSSCSSNDDPTPDPSSKDKAPTKTTAVVTYYVNAKTLDYFKVEAIDAAGNAVEITKDNTTEVASLPQSDPLSSTINAQTGDGNKLRAYTGKQTTFSSFPSTFSCSIRTTALDVTMAETEKFGVIAYPCVTIDNDGTGNKKWKDVNLHLSFMYTASTGKGWENYKQKRYIGTYTTTCTLSNADSYSVEGVDQKFKGKE